MAGPPTEIVFYDGACGLCHRWVRFLLFVDRNGLLRFAPLDGDAFRKRVPEAARRGVPDSLVVLSPDDELRVRSEGVLHVLRCVGGAWGLTAGVIDLVPRPILDAFYDGVARVRHRLFRRPAESCPRVPQEFRDRFLL